MGFFDRFRKPKDDGYLGFTRQRRMGRGKESSMASTRNAATAMKESAQRKLGYVKPPAPAPKTKKDIDLSLD